jgi:steroid delta-isomerase-like uncharacterized protein|tara:strand:+ start:103 stop:525 length:423 start_codon:yes stop_codon:yes gene_type:complete
MTTRHLAFFGILILVCTVSYGVVANTINDESMQSYYAAWTKGDVDGVMSYFTDDIVYADVATGARSSGTTEVRAFVQKFVDNYAGVKLAVASITIGESSAAVEWVMSGGTAEEAWSIPGVCVFKIVDGRFSSATDYWNKE